MKKVIWFCLIAIGCSAPKMAINVNVVSEGPFTVNFKKGIPAFGASRIDYKREGKSVLAIEFKEPVVVAVASKPEKWGFFQFPSIGFKPNGEIQAKWNMTRDAIEAYGENTFGASVSKDKGKTWTLQDSTYLTPQVIAPNGDYLDNVNPKPIKITELKLPKPVGEGVENYRKSNFAFYRLSELPESRQGVFFKRLKKGDGTWKMEQATLTDPDAARYSLSGLLPVVWWGDIHITKDKTMIAGIYPGFIIKDGKADPRSGAFFYRSTDNGKSWNIQGRLNYSDDLVGDPQQGKRMGFTEPAFEILSDGTFLCVLRTTDGAGIGPMFAAFSKDEGKTWTKPEVIAGNGVLPRLLQLENGVTVLSSGRPGVQLRFSTDPSGMKWSEAFEMLPYQAEASGKELNGVTAAVSDGYTGLLPLDKNRLLLIYSDFAYQTANKEIRKAIKVREIVVKVR